MRISYLGVRLGESIPRICFSTDFGFKATRLRFAWAGCPRDCIWSVWVHWHQMVQGHWSWTAQICWSLAWPQNFLPDRKEKRKLGRESGSQEVSLRIPGLPASVSESGIFQLPCVGCLLWVILLGQTQSAAWPRIHRNPFGSLERGKIWYQPKQSYSSISPSSSSLKSRYPSH